MRVFRLAILPALILAGCNGAGEAVQPSNAADAATPQASGKPFAVQEVAQFNEPWAMTFLPDGRALVTEQPGRLLIWSEDGQTIEVAGVPEVDYGGQGGLGDVVLHPDFANNGLVYLSYAEAGDGGTRGAAVGRGRLLFTSAAAPGAPVGVRLDGFEVIWRQQPKVSGRGHYGHRLAFSPGGDLFITSGDRQKGAPAQDMGATLGKTIRLAPSGASEIWTLGHRNPLGIAFDGDGRLWAHEMGPRGGDELNLIEKGGNYGWPVVSNGDDYSGAPIPDHRTQPRFVEPNLWWNPSISPAGLIVYSGDMFPEWRGDAIMGALSGEALILVDLDGADARKADQWDMGQRIREVEQGPDGAIYLLEDDPGGRLLKLTPAD